MSIAEQRLTDSLGKTCRLIVSNSLDESAVKVVQRIEDEMFRPELRYTPHELVSRAGEKGFILFTVLCEDQPVAFLHGYSDPEDTLTFYLDSVATFVEGRGIGSTLVTLALIHSYEVGYRLVTLYTEEKDDKGRLLRRFYEKLGFSFLFENPKDGVCMVEKLDADTVSRVFLKSVLPVKK